MTYSDLIKEGAELLSDANISEAALDARLLLEYICHTDRNMLYSHPDKEVSQVEETLYRNLLSKRADRIPLQHLTGSQEFMGLNFIVNSDVLVPRQDTEFLVEEAMKYTQDGMRVIDLCTGSGCILLSIMNYKNNITGVGVDISDGALSVAKDNANELGINPSPIFVKCDLTSENAVSDLLVSINEEKSDINKFDILVSNPPYIRTKIISTLDPEVKDHDPMIALDGGEDGLIFYRIIASKGKELLTNYGRLFLEIGYDQKEDVEAILLNEGYKDIKTLKDYAGLDRVTTAIFTK